LYNRPVLIYSIAITSPTAKFTSGIPIPAEPLDLNWRNIVKAQKPSILLWEGGTSPVIIPAKDVGNFRVQTKIDPPDYGQQFIIIQALSSEGKMATYYTISADAVHPTINTYYTDDPSDPTNNWSYLIRNIPAGKIAQVFNATLENSSTNTLTSKIQLIILIPSDFINIIDVSNGSGGWEVASIVANPDESHIITVSTDTSPFGALAVQTYQFSADVPILSENKLYVFQTTTVYPSWNSGDNTQIASALSEAGVQVVP